MRALVEWLRRLREPGAWSARRSLLNFIVLAALVGWVLSAGWRFPTKRLTKHRAPPNVWLVRGVAAGLFGAVGVVLWALTRAVYLNSGKHLKIGLAYDRDTLQAGDLVRTRRRLRRLFRAARLRQIVCLRFVPTSALTSLEKGAKLKDRYRFIFVARVVKSPRPGGADRKASPPAPAYKIDIPSRADRERFLSASLDQGLTLWTTKAGGRSLAEFLDLEAPSVCDALLMLAAAVCYLDGDADRAAAIARSLDQELAARGVRPDQKPRPQIRWLDASACMADAVFAANAIPEREVLRSRLRVAEEALRYADDFPELLCPIARLRFLAGDTEQALKLGQSTPLARLRDTHKAVAQCNLGFLYCVAGQWAEAKSAYRSLLSNEAHQTLHWKDWAEFAARACQSGHPHAVFPQVFYRTLGKLPISRELRGRYQEWAATRDRRKSLVTLQDGVEGAAPAPARRAAPRRQRQTPRKPRGRPHGKPLGKKPRRRR